MAETQNNKKSPVKRKKVKKGSPAKRSFFFKPASMILALLATLLLVLGIIYLARVQHWFTPEKPATSTETAKKKAVSLPAQGEKAALSGENYDNSPLPRREKQPLINEHVPLVAIIVDDLGADLALMQRLLDLHFDLTSAVLPNAPYARAVAELAHANGREVLLHVPMEPLDYPTFNPGKNALMVDLPISEVQQRLREYLHTVPWVVGANNHMGSRFTENREGMQTVLQVLKEQGLFFIDSRTTADSVAISEAEQMGIVHAGRDVFLDNELSEEAIRSQIHKLIKIAKEHGSAIGICHPHLVTFATLKKEVPAFAAAGVKLVSASTLINRPHN